MNHSGGGKLIYSRLNGQPGTLTSREVFTNDTAEDGDYFDCASKISPREKKYIGEEIIYSRLTDEPEQPRSSAAKILPDDVSSEEEYLSCEGDISPRNVNNLTKDSATGCHKPDVNHKPLANGHSTQKIQQDVEHISTASNRQDLALRSSQGHSLDQDLYDALSTLSEQDDGESVSPFVANYFLWKMQNIDVPLNVLEAVALHSVEMEKKGVAESLRQNIDLFFPWMNGLINPFFQLYISVANDYKELGEIRKALMFCYRAYAQLEFEAIQTELQEMEEFYFPLRMRLLSHMISFQGSTVPVIALSSDQMCEIQETLARYNFAVSRCFIQFIREQVKMQVLSELCDLAFFYMEKQKSFCLIICNHVREMYLHIGIGCPQQKHFINGGMKRVFTIFALFFLKTNAWSDSIRFCKTGLEQLCDYDDVKLLEIWSVALSKLGKIDIALKKAQEALHHAKDGNDKETLHILIEKLKQRKECEIEGKNVSSEPDEDWLKDTNVLTCVKQRDMARRTNAENGHKKKRRTRPKRKEQPVQVRLSNGQLFDTASVTSDSSCFSNGTDTGCINKWDQLSKTKDDFKDYILKRYISQQNSQKVPQTQSGSLDLRKELSVIDFTDSGSDSDSDKDSQASNDCGEVPIEDGNNRVEKAEKNIYEESKCLHLKNEKIDDIYHRISVGEIELSEVELDKYSDNNHYKRKRSYEPYYKKSLNKRELQDCLRQDPRTYIHCTIDFRSSHLAMCKPVKRSYIDEIEIHGRSRCGHDVFNDDEVVVEIIEENQPNKQEHTSGKVHKNSIFGKVLGSLKRHRRADQLNPVFVCSVDETASYLMKPLCKTIPKIEVFHSHIRKKVPEHAQKYKVEIWGLNKSDELYFKNFYNINPTVSFQNLFRVAYVHWSHYNCYPHGVVVEVIPCNSNLNTGDLVLRMQNNVPYLYSEQAVRESELMLKEDYRETDTMFRLRKDLSHLQTFTIDPETSQDLDDALSFEENSDGTLRVGVHIADVASTVLKDTGLDNEAFSRAQSFYPPEKQTIHMFPNPVVKQCSLLPGLKRKTISLFLTYCKENSKLKRTELCCSTICSSRKLSYLDAQKIIEGTASDELSEKLQKLNSLAQLLRKKRLGGASNAVLFEDLFLQLGEHYSRSPNAHQLIEEFMIAANCQIAKYVLKKFPQCVPLRIQDSPSEESIQNFVKHFGEPAINSVLKLQNRTLNDYVTISAHQNERKHISEKVPIVDSVWRALRGAAQSSNLDGLKNLICTDGLHPIQQLVIKYWISLQQSAEYICSGECDKACDRRHFDLNVDAYTHFTSPIRRFNDVVIQRLVHAGLKDNKCPYSSEEVSQICKTITIGFKRARSYKNKILLHKIAEKLKRHPYSTYAFVKEITDEGLVLTASGLSQDIEIGFSSLGVKTVPTIFDHKAASFIPCDQAVRVRWDKAVFDCTGRPSFSIIPKMGKKIEELKIDPLSHSILVPLKEWTNLMVPFLNTGPSDMKKMKKLLDKPNELATHMRSMQTVKDVSSEINKDQDGTWKNLSCCFSQSYMIGQVVKLQLSASLKDAILVPSAQLFSVSPSYQCCIQHIKDAVNCYATYEASPTSDTYFSHDEYLETWLPLMLMESASESVQSEENVLINNVKTIFKFRNDRVEGQMTLQLTFCEERNIEFGGQPMDQIGSKDEEEEMISLSSVDFICIRCTINRDINNSILSEQKFTWIGHGQIESVRKRKKSNKVIVFFKLKSSPQTIPRDLLGEKVCCVEIIPKSETSRKEEYYMKMITDDKHASDLGKALVLSLSGIPQLEKGHLKLGQKIDKDVTSGIPDKNLPSNNINQHYAIEKALTSSITLIQGPPGTGKTYTGLKLICLFNEINEELRKEGGKRKQVLFCGPSNNSVDVMAKFLLNRLDDTKRPRILRIQGKTEVCKDFPIPKRNVSKMRSARLYKADDSIRNISLHHRIRCPHNSHASDIKKFDIKFRKLPDAVTINEIKQYNKLIAEAEKEEIPKYDVLFCTCAAAGNRRFVASSSVYQCIVDESGMCTEPQTLVPIVAHKAKQVVLIGDHRQLRPIINCPEAAELGLEKSLFERYSDNACFLNIQYRMHPQICAFPSKAFYGGKLRTGNSVWWKDDFPLKLWPREEFPHLFINVEGEEDTLTVTTAQGNEKSKSNKEEIAEVVRIFKLLVEKEGKNSERIMILSQYKSQCNEIKKALSIERFIEFNVSTVVSSQGGEWDYVIFSTVRSLPHYKIEPHPTLGWCKHNLGFTADKHQMNVALTRARKGLIIIGNKNLLKCDRNWKNLLKEYEEQGCLKEPSEVPKTWKIYLRPELAPRFQKQKEQQQQTAEEFYQDTEYEYEYAESEDSFYY